MTNFSHLFPNAIAENFVLFLINDVTPLLKTSQLWFCKEFSEFSLFYCSTFPLLLSLPVFIDLILVSLVFQQEASPNNVVDATKSFSVLRFFMINSIYIFIKYLKTFSVDLWWFFIDFAKFLALREQEGMVI